MAKEPVEPIVKVPPEYSSALPDCDRVEVLLLGEAQEKAGENTFPIHEDGLHAPIKERKELKGAEATHLCATWRGLTFDLWSQALCHIPGYALRFYRADKLIFETSVCFGCSNFWHPTPGGGGSFHGFRTNDAAGKALIGLLKKTLPPDKKVDPK